MERLGKFHRTLQAGLNFLIPFVDDVKFVYSMKEIAIEIPQQSAITQGLFHKLIWSKVWFNELQIMQLFDGMQSFSFVFEMHFKQAMELVIPRLPFFYSFTPKWGKALVKKFNLLLNLVDINQIRDWKSQSGKDPRWKRIN